MIMSQTELLLLDLCCVAHLYVW